MDGGLNKLAVQSKTMAEKFESGGDVQETMKKRTSGNCAMDFATANHGKVCHNINLASDVVDGQVYATRSNFTSLQLGCSHCWIFFNNDIFTSQKGEHLLTLSPRPQDRIMDKKSLFRSMLNSTSMLNILYRRLLCYEREKDKSR